MDLILKILSGSIWQVTNSFDISNCVWSRGSPFKIAERHKFELFQEERVPTQYCCKSK